MAGYPDMAPGGNEIWYHSVQTSYIPTTGGKKKMWRKWQIWRARRLHRALRRIMLHKLKMAKCTVPLLDLEIELQRLSGPLIYDFTSPLVKFPWTTFEP